MLPKSFGVEIYHYLPNNNIYQSKYKKRKRKKATDKNHWTKHHKMIPIENSAGCTTLVTEHKTEGTPNKHTYKVANVKSNTYQQNMSAIDNL